MKGISLLSSGNYLVLPNKRYPKLFIAINNRDVLRNAFKLHNPFSLKAKCYKALIVFVASYLKPIITWLLPKIEIKQSLFSEHLDNIFGEKFFLTLYNATDGNKVVIQLLDEKANVFGYLKFAITDLGKERVLHEIDAIKILSKQGLIADIRYKGEFEDSPFFIVENIDGEIKRLQDDSYKNVLKLFYKSKKYQINRHPRVLSILSGLNSLGLERYVLIMDEIMENSQLTYREVYEHGDFAPWNLIQKEDEIIPFDFEFFVEIGLEFLDEIKYHFQINHLLKGLKGQALINAIKAGTSIPEFDMLFHIFLFKEIVNKHSLNKSIELEESLINIMVFNHE